MCNAYKIETILFFEMLVWDKNKKRMFKLVKLKSQYPQVFFFFKEIFLEIFQINVLILDSLLKHFNLACF